MNSQIPVEPTQIVPKMAILHVNSILAPSKETVIGTAAPPETDATVCQDLGETKYVGSDMPDGYMDVTH